MPKSVTVTPRAKIKLLRVELRYAQMMNRLDARNLRAGVKKVKRIAEQMRSLQADMPPRKSKSKRSGEWQ